MKTKLVLLSMALLIVAVPAMAGGEKCSAADAQACLKGWASNKSHAWLGLQYDKATAGPITVKSIQAGSPAATAGFQVGDELVALNGAAMTDKEAMKKAKGEWKAGQSVIYTIKRAGAEQKITAVLAEMPEEAFAAMLGRHMLEAHVAVATAAATETKTETKTTTTTDKK